MLSGEYRQSVGVPCGSCRKSTSIGWILLGVEGGSLEFCFTCLPIPNGNKSFKRKTMIHKILRASKSWTVISYASSVLLAFEERSFNKEPPA